MAVVTTLYGLIAANFIFAPLGNAIARKSRREESDREEVLTCQRIASAADAARPRPAADTPSIEEVQTDAERSQPRHDPRDFGLVTITADLALILFLITAQAAEPRA